MTEDSDYSELRDDLDTLRSDLDALRADLDALRFDWANTMTSRQVRIIDRQGRTRVTMGVDGDTAGVLLYDAAGKVRLMGAVSEERGGAQVGILDDNEVHQWVLNEEGLHDASQTREK